MGFGNFPKIEILSQRMTENPSNWENSQLLVTLPPTPRQAKLVIYWPPSALAKPAQWKIAIPTRHGLIIRERNSTVELIFYLTKMHVNR